jgi:hypothetical protein
MEQVTSNIINDLRIVNQKTDASLFGLRSFIDFMGKQEEFNKFIEEKKKQQDKERDERTKSTEASAKADSNESSK